MAPPLSSNVMLGKFLQIFELRVLTLKMGLLIELTSQAIMWTQESTAYKVHTPIITHDRDFHIVYNFLQR